MVSWPQYSPLIGQLATILTSDWLSRFQDQVKVEDLNFYTENKEWILLNTTVE